MPIEVYRDECSYTGQIIIVPVMDCCILVYRNGRQLGEDQYSLLVSRDHISLDVHAVDGDTIEVIAHGFGEWNREPEHICWYQQPKQPKRIPVRLLRPTTGRLAHWEWWVETLHPPRHAFATVVGDLSPMPILTQIACGT